MYWCINNYTRNEPAVTIKDINGMQRSNAQHFGAYIIRPNIEIG
jgi:hypothetical protein